MTALSLFKKYTYAVAANEDLPLDISGRYVACNASVGSFQIAVDDSEFSEMDVLTMGETEGGEVFERIILRDTSGAPNEISITVGMGNFRDNRTAIPDGVPLQGSATNPTTADKALTAVTATEIIAANSSRREVIISNLSTNGAVMRIGDANVAAARGAELSPGQSIILSTKAAVYGYSVPGESVGIMEVVN